MLIKKLLPSIRENVSLASYTSFKIGGPARYFFLAKNKDDLLKAVMAAKELNLPFFILGGGSNLLVSDKGYKGLVIKTGESLSSYVLKGLEWAAGIPGTIQGAVYGNAGAFGKSMKDAVESVEVFDLKTGGIKVFKNRDCKFAYRTSIFKKNKNLIIVSVKIVDEAKVSSPRITGARIKEYLNYKKDTQPLNFPSAGSVFKNPAGFSAGELIEKCGLKGKKIGQAAISEKHANFIVNLGKGKAKDVVGLIKLIKAKVKNKFKINLEEEIQFLGF
ncbi:MAG: UDP-N-acetylmuramate dehydrogenase [bacterium]|nr:UDP-N-acetylmuramate dehydrogenase [bacterium]